VKEARAGACASLPTAHGPRSEPRCSWRSRQSSRRCRRLVLLLTGARLTPATSRMTFEQKQIPHVWIELHLPPATDAQGEPDFAISPRHLHIWPRQEFMLIALPNKVRPEFTR